MDSDHFKVHVVLVFKCGAMRRDFPFCRSMNVPLNIYRSIYIHAFRATRNPINELPLDVCETRVTCAPFFSASTLSATVSLRVNGSDDTMVRVDDEEILNSGECVKLRHDTSETV